MKHQRPPSTLKQEISSIELFSNARGEIRVSSLLQLITEIDYAILSFLSHFFSSLDNMVIVKQKGL